jgi:hypothetical protein
MRARSWLAALLPALALLIALPADGVAAAPVTIRVDVSGIIPYGGAFDSGAKNTAAITTGDISFNVTDASNLQPGVKILIDSEKMTVIDSSGDGVGGGTDHVTVLRTFPAAHNANRTIYATVFSTSVRAEGVAPVPTGSTLSSNLTTSTFEDSGAVLTGNFSAGATWINVSDSTQISGASKMKLNALTATGATNSSFLASGGRSPTCEAPKSQPTYGGLLCYTLGSGGSGATGSGLLATVNLSADGPGLYTLSLTNAQLVDATVNANTIPITELIGAIVAVGVDAPPAPPPPGSPTGTRLRVEPSLTSVAVGGAFNLEVWIDNVTNLGAYDFRLDWGAGALELTLSQVRKGYLDNAGSPWNQGQTLTGAVNASVTSIPVTNASTVQPGWTALIDSEELLITSTTASAVNVVRGYRGTTAAPHNNGTIMYTGPERVQTSAPAASPHMAGAPIQLDAVKAPVTDPANLQFDDNLKIEDEYFRLAQSSIRDLVATGSTLSSAVTSSATTITTSAAVSVGDVIDIKGERMAVISKSGNTLGVVRGFSGTLAVAHAAGTPISRIGSVANTVRMLRGQHASVVAAHASGSEILDADGLGAYLTAIGYTPQPSGTQTAGAIDEFTTSINVANGALLAPEWIVILESERVRIESIAGNTLTVTRAVDGTARAPHADGTAIIGPVMLDLINLSDSGWLASTGRTVNCAALVRTSTSLERSCSSTGTQLGSTGTSGYMTLKINARLRQEDNNTPSVSIPAASLTDTSGDVLAQTTVQAPFLIVRCPDVDGDTLVTFPGDVLGIAKAFFGQIPKLPVHDIDLDGLLTFPGDVLRTANMFFGNGPARCIA